MSNEEQNTVQAELLLQFKDDHEKTLVEIVIFLSIVAGFIPPLIIWALKKEDFSISVQKVILDILNFELTILLCSLICWIPFVGWVLSTLLLPVLWIWNLIICILMLSAVSKNREYKIPFMLELIK